MGQSLVSMTTSTLTNLRHHQPKILGGTGPLGVKQRGGSWLQAKQPPPSTWPGGSLPGSRYQVEPSGTPLPPVWPKKQQLVRETDYQSPPCPPDLLSHNLHFNNIPGFMKP